MLGTENMYINRGYLYYPLLIRILSHATRCLYMLVYRPFVISPTIHTFYKRDPGLMNHDHEATSHHTIYSTAKFDVLGKALGKFVA